jgi:hypothetical protein
MVRNHQEVSRLMDGAGLLASDPRVRAILTEPDAYFSAALRRAWPQARADIELELNRRIHTRRNDISAIRLFRTFLRPRHRLIPVSHYRPPDQGPKEYEPNH